MTGGFDGGPQVTADLNGDVVAVLHQKGGDRQKWIEVSGPGYRSDKNFHRTFVLAGGEIEAGL